MFKKVSIDTLIGTLILAGISAIWDVSVWPLSIVSGGLLGLANYKAMTWGVEGLITAYKASPVLVLFSMMRIILLLVIIGWLVSKGIVNIPGVMIGLTVVVVAVMKEGISHAKDNSN